MRNFVVVLENSCTREVLGDVCTRGAIGQRLAEWLDAALLAVGTRGVCKSFVVGVHQAGVDCDHETKVPHE